MRRPRDLFVAVGVLLVSLSGIAAANSSGPLSGSVGTGCGNGCHGTTPNPQITLEAPGQVDGTAIEYPIRVAVDDSLAGGGGFMLEASAGRIDFEQGSGIRRAFLGSGLNEVSHDGSRPELRDWLVSWRMNGPVTGCAIDLRAAAMATNADAYETGDRWGAVSSVIDLVPTGDTSKPTGPTFVAPTRGSVVNAGVPVSAVGNSSPVTVVIGSVTFRLKATDDTGVRGVVLHDSDVLGSEAELGPATFDKKKSEWTLRWTTAGVTPGPHKIRAVAEDCAGNLSEATFDLVAF